MEKASDSESVVLTALSEKGQSTVTELHAKLWGFRSWSHSTVATLLRRLEAKGLVKHSRLPGQRAFVFRPTSKAHTLRFRAVHDVMDRLFGGNPLPLVSSLIEEGRLTSEQIRELHQLIEEHLQGREREP